MVREAQAVAQLTHPNVVGVFDVGEEKGRSYISMEYVEGQDARHLLADKGPLDVAECLDLMTQMTAGLGYAHGKGVTHRDIKPENVMVTEDGIVKLMDFGLAIVEGATRLTRPGGISGTLQYMAPEQVRGEQALTPAVDVYATGCMAYELLVGEPPFTGSMAEIGIKHLNQPPTPIQELRPDVPDSVAEVVMRCMAKEPEDRYADANELNTAFREVAASL